jgi:hypothetical protein
VAAAITAIAPATSTALAITHAYTTPQENLITVDILDIDTQRSGNGAIARHDPARQTPPPSRLTFLSRKNSSGASS